MNSKVCLIFAVSVQLASSQFLSYRAPRNIITSQLMEKHGTPTSPCSAGNFNNINTFTGTVIPVTPARNGNIGNANILAGNLGALTGTTVPVISARNGNIGNGNILAGNLGDLTGTTLPVTLARNGNIGNANILAGNLGALTGTTVPVTLARNGNIGNANILAGNLGALTGTRVPVTLAKNGNNCNANIPVGNVGNLMIDNLGNINLARVASPCGPCGRNNHLANALPLINGIGNSNLGGVAGVPLTNSLANSLTCNAMKFIAPINANAQIGNVARLAIGNNGAYGFATGFPGNQRGLQIEANNLLIDGQLAATGHLPVLGGVAVNGQVLTDGIATGNYGCGRNVNLVY